MGKLTMTAFVSLDGVMQAPGGPSEDQSGGFKYGGWLAPYFDEEGAGKFMVSVFERADAFLLGRATYDIFAGFWPKHNEPGDPIANKLNDLPKHVATRTREKVEWKNSSIVRDLVKEVPALKAKYSRELQVHGSANLLTALLEHDLLDELNLLHFPVLLGTGKRLFLPSAKPSALEHKETQTTAKGVVITRHVRLGEPPKTGSVSGDI